MLNTYLEISTRWKTLLLYSNHTNNILYFLSQLKYFGISIQKSPTWIFSRIRKFVTDEPPANNQNISVCLGDQCKWSSHSLRHSTYTGKKVQPSRPGCAPDQYISIFWGKILNLIKIMFRAEKNWNART